MFVVASGVVVGGLNIVKNVYLNSEFATANKLFLPFCRAFSGSARHARRRRAQRGRRRRVDSA